MWFFKWNKRKNNFELRFNTCILVVDLLQGGQYLTLYTNTNSDAEGRDQVRGDGRYLVSGLHPKGARPYAQR